MGSSAPMTKATTANTELSTGSRTDLSVKRPEPQEYQAAISQSETQESVIDKSQLPSFPTLDFRLLQKDGNLEPNFPLNTRTGVPFETDLFQGKVGSYRCFKGEISQKRIPNIDLINHIVKSDLKFFKGDWLLFKC